MMQNGRINSATYLWHCRFGHIGVKRMKKIHVDGILESLDYESVDACEPCCNAPDVTCHICTPTLAIFGVKL